MQSLSHLASAFQPLPTFAIVLVPELKLERGDIMRAPGELAGYLSDKGALPLNLTPGGGGGGLFDA